MWYVRERPLSLRVRACLRVHVFRVCVCVSVGVCHDCVLVRRHFEAPHDIFFEISTRHHTRSLFVRCYTDLIFPQQHSELLAWQYVMVRSGSVPGSGMCESQVWCVMSHGMRRGRATPKHGAEP